MYGTLRIKVKKCTPNADDNRGANAGKFSDNSGNVVSSSVEMTLKSPTSLKSKLATSMSKSMTSSLTSKSMT